MNTATALTYQCPACAAGLSFSPEKGKLVCEFCKSEYTEDEVIAANERALAEAAASTAAEEAAAAAAPAPEPKPSKEEVLLTEIRDLLKEKRDK